MLKDCTKEQVSKYVVRNNSNGWGNLKEPMAWNIHLINELIKMY